MVMTPQNNNGTKRKWAIVSGVASLTTVLAVVLGFVWGASASKAKIETLCDTNQERICDHEGRMRDLEKAIPRIDENLRWIKDKLSDE